MIEPGSGRILVATGNAPFNGSTNWGDSVLELSPDGRALLHNWTPANQAQLNANDGDLGSTAPAVLPRFGGFRLAVQGGKDGVLRLLEPRPARTGRRGGAGPRLGGELQRIPTPGVRTRVHGAGRVVARGRVYVFVAEASGTSAYVLAGTQPRLRVAWSERGAGTSPVRRRGLLYVFDPGGSLNVYSAGERRTS